MSTTEARIYPPLTLLSQGHGGVHRKRYVWRPGKDSNFRRRCRRPSTVPRPGRCKVPASWSSLDETVNESPRWDLHPGLRNIGAEEGTRIPAINVGNVVSHLGTPACLVAAERIELSSTGYQPVAQATVLYRSCMVGMTGFEPVASRIRIEISTRLSYIPKMVRRAGFEPAAPRAQGECSGQTELTTDSGVCGSPLPCVG